MAASPPATAPEADHGADHGAVSPGHDASGRDTGAAAPTSSARRPSLPRLLRTARTVLGVLVLVAAVLWLVQVVELGLVADTFTAVAAAPLPVAAALLAYALAFALRSLTWTWLQPGVGRGQAWAAVHVGLLGNHVLPLRLGEVLRVTSATRRAGVGVRETAAVTLALRLGDLLALLAVAALTAPAALLAVAPAWVAAAVALTLLAGILLAWLGLRPRTAAGVPAGMLLTVAGLTVLAWVLEAGVLLAVARAAGLPIGLAEAAGVTAVTVFAQVVAVTPGGLGTYEAAGTAALVALGTDAGVAFAVVLSTHAVKTAYSIVLGGVALLAPAPGLWGRWRLPPAEQRPGRPAALEAAAAAPVVVFLPAHDEAEVIGGVLARIPDRVAGRPVVVVVVDDGSTDDTAAVAERCGAVVLRQPTNLGLGAAVRVGLAACVQRGAAAGVYLDADGEYRPEDIDEVVAPVLQGRADYVVGSRFAGRIEHMRPHRRVGNQVLTRWVRWMTRRRDLTDGQSGFRAFSPAALAAAEVIHDYNYAQVLTLDLLAKGFVYAEVPIGYSFRTTGRSFVSLGRYLRRVVPAVHRELNSP